MKSMVARVTLGGVYEHAISTYRVTITIQNRIYEKSWLEGLRTYAYMKL
jgi:hypothetical protein